MRVGRRGRLSVHLGQIEEEARDGRGCRLARRRADPLEMAAEACRRMAPEASVTGGGRRAAAFLEEARSGRREESAAEAEFQLMPANPMPRPLRCLAVLAAVVHLLD